MSDTELIYDEIDIPNIQDPIWASDEDIAEMRIVDDPNDEAEPEATELRLNTGALQFLENLVEEVRCYLEDDKRPEPRPVRNKPVAVQDIPACKWRGRTATVTERCVRVLVESPQRRRIKLWNMTDQPVYLSSTSVAGSGSPNQFPMPAADAAANYYPQVCIDSSDDLWAIAPAGQTVTLGIIEEFDL